MPHDVGMSFIQPHKEKCELQSICTVGYGALFIAQDLANLANFCDRKILASPTATATAP